MWFQKKKTNIVEMKETLPRAEVLHRGRIAILDDELPEMLGDLRAQGLSVSHLQSTDDAQFQALADGAYDLLLLDYGGIGPRFGHDEGLDVLRYLKRVNPALRILAFTARTFDASKADFFRLCDGVVKKDAGIRETLEQIEGHLSEVLTPSYQLAALTKALGLSPEQQVQMERILSAVVAGKQDRGTAVQTAKRFAKGGSEKVLEALVGKAIELAIAHLATAR
jgi:DNA-binding NarL/FixJ family response regulator